MSIHWEPYQRMHEFTLLEAAFLWLEIEPTKEMLESPPFSVEAKRKLLHYELNLYFKEQLYSYIWHSMREEGLSENEAIDEYIRSFQERVIDFMDLTKEQKVRRKELMRKTPITENDRQELQYEHSEIKKVDIETLKEVAQKLNEKPKFLFPKERPSKSQESEEEQKPKKLDKRKIKTYNYIIECLLKKLKEKSIDKYSEYELRRGSLDELIREGYLKIIKDLFIELNLYPFDSSTVGKVTPWLQSLSIGTIRTVIGEIDPEYKIKNKKNSQ